MLSPWQGRGWVLIVAFWLVAAAFIGIDGEFPLFDDWAYTDSVRILHERGVLWLHDQQAILLLPQLAVGWAATALTGFHYASLRVIGLASGLGAALATYAAVRTLSQRELPAVMAGAAVCINPILLISSFSFLSDAPTMALSASALACFSIAVMRPSRTFLALAIVCAVLATLNRQSAIVCAAGIAAAFAVPLRTAESGFDQKGSGLTPLMRFGAAFAIMAGTGLALWIGEQMVVALSGKLPWVYVHRQGDVRTTLAAIATPAGLYDVTWAATRQLLYLGLYAAPLSVARAWQWRTAGNGIAAALLVVLVVADRPLPVLGGLLYEHGVGPVLIAGSVDSKLSGTFWWALTVLALVGLAALIDVVLHAVRSTWGHEVIDVRVTRVRIACLTAVALLVGLHALVGPFDRHLLVIMPMICVLLALDDRLLGVKGVRYVPAVGVSVIVGALSLALARDAMEWQRVRWTIVRTLEARGVTSATIDGGYEYNRPTSDDGRDAYHLSFTDAADDSPLCGRYVALVGPQAAAICARSGPAPRMP